MQVSPTTKINRKFTIKSIDHPGWVESHATIPGLEAESELKRALEALPGAGTQTVTGVDLFGSRQQVAEMEASVRRAGITAPLTQVLSTTSDQGGIQMTAAAGVHLTPLILDQEVVGYAWKDSDACHCILGGIKPRNAQESREQQADEVFSTIERALSLAGMGFEHVVRTWFYNDKILDWYSTFNAVRTEYFSRHSIRRMPASTGIGAPNPPGTALVAKAVACLPLPDGAKIHIAPSPMQCDAFAYGSAFSRALEVAGSRSRTLYISGTASIEPSGKTARLGDPSAQISLTMDVVDAILNRAGMRGKDVTRAVAYFRNPSDIPLWQEYCKNHKIPALPVIILAGDVCRDDLLFEIELDAAASR